MNSFACHHLITGQISDESERRKLDESHGPLFESAEWALLNLLEISHRVRCFEPPSCVVERRLGHPETVWEQSSTELAGRT